MRGDGPYILAHIFDKMEVPPHARGWSRDEHGISSVVDGFISVDPTDAVRNVDRDSNPNSEARRKRGRPRGSKSGSGSDENKNSASLRGISLKEIFVSIHLMLAIRLKSETWKLSDDEAKELDSAVKLVWRHYPANITQKQMDIGMACWTLANVYGVRIVSTIAEKRAAKLASDDSINENVVSMFPAV